MTKAPAAIPAAMTNQMRIAISMPRRDRSSLSTDGRSRNAAPETGPSVPEAGPHHLRRARGPDLRGLIPDHRAHRDAGPALSSPERDSAYAGPGFAGPGEPLSRGFYVDLVDVAPHPVLAGLHRSNDRMVGLPRVFAGVLVRRGVAAAHGATAQAHAQVDPLVAGRDALGAAIAIRDDTLDRVPVGAADGAGVERGRGSMVGLRAGVARTEARVRRSRDAAGTALR